ncbi:MAG: (2Fe-2S)-binding protein [Pseudomonadota bacterium]
MKHEIELRVNGQNYEMEIEPWRTLLEVLRCRVGLTGTKQSCNEGHCGACTVIVDGQAVNSCLMLAVEAQGRDVVTIEGLSEGGSLHPVQEAFVTKGAVQCGFCSPGMIMAAKAFLDRDQDPSTEDIRRALSGHLCRCTGYTQITEAVRAAAENMKSTRTRS